MRRRVLLMLMLSVLVFLPAQATDWSGVYKQVYLQNLVQLVIGTEGFCTAEQVAPNQYLSAAHCVLHDVQVFHFRDQFGIIYKAEVIDSNQFMDLALLSGVVPNKVPIRMATRSPEIGTELAAIGYHSAPLRPDMTVSHLFQFFTRFLVVDQPHQYGYSGGPLVNFAGEMVGVNVQTNFDDSIGISVPIEWVRTFLDQARLHATGHSDLD